MKEINLTINGKPLSGKEGDTVLDICQAQGIDVPTLCHYKGLSDVGACRMCVVEIERERKPVPSCTYPARDGLVVQTHTEKLEKYRRFILELLLSEHEHNCLYCESNGQCELQTLVYKYKIDKISFPINKVLDPLDDSSEVILRDPNKCILCGRCVRACAETAVRNILDFGNRGGQTFVVAGLKDQLAQADCVSCGACLQACPTGALTEKLARFQGRVGEFREVRTTCSYCGVGCQMELNVKDDRLVKVYGVEDAPANRGHLCVKGRFGFDYVHHPERLTTPLIKRNGKFEPASWDEALNLVAVRLKELKAKYGSEALAGLSSAKCTNEENYLFQKFVRASLGTNNVDHCARLCHASTLAALARAFGSGAMTNSIRDLEKSDVVLVTGSNTTEAHPVIGDLIKHQVRHGGLKLIVVDPRAIELTEFATLWLRQRNGTDVAWINGLMNVIINEGLHDEAFIRDRTENFDEVKKVVAQYTPEKVEEIAGIPREQLIAAARLYGKAESAAIIYSMGITQHTTGTDNCLSLANLAMLTGNVGREGTGVNPLRGQNNVQGACDVGALPSFYPGYRKVSEAAAQEKFEGAWGVKLPQRDGLTVVEIMHAANEGKIKGLYIMGENPMLSDPNLNHVKEALENLEFLVVQDIFLSETAQLADVVLPGVSFSEKDGTFTSTERRVQRVRQAIPAVGQSRQDWEIISEVSSRLGYPMSYRSPAEVMDELASLVPIYGGIRYNRLEGDGLQWPCPNPEHPGTPYLHKDQFTRGKGLFTGVSYLPPAELPGDGYPFLLTTGRILYHYHTILSRRSKTLDRLVPEGFLEVNPSDAEKLGIKDHDLVRVSSRRGQIDARAKVTERVREGTVFATFHFAEAAANLLTIDALDPVAKIPEYKVCAVRLEPCG